MVLKIYKNTCHNHSFSLTCQLYLLILYQESISDFYWYYSGKEVIDEAGQRNFSKALAVAKQVFNSLTEYIQVQWHNELQHNKNSLQSKLHYMNNLICSL